MTKAELISEIAQQHNLDKDNVQKAIEGFFEVVKNKMEEGENIYVRGFGSFINKKRAEKVARDISQKKPIIIPEHYVPSFKPSKVFIDQIKNSEKVTKDVKKSTAKK